MNHEEIMKKALHTWATKLKVHSHVFVAALLKPAFKAAYEAGKKDQRKSTGTAENGVTAGFRVVKKLTGQK